MGFFIRVFNRKWLAVLAILIAVDVLAASAEMVHGSDIDGVPEARHINSILKQPESSMDLARIKLTIDKMIDPTINIDAGLKQIEGIVAKIRAMSGGNPSSNEKLQALKKYLHEKGPWNDYRVYSYDLDDPFAKKIRNKLLPIYLASKKGNCVTMPLLFVVLGQRLGMDVTISTAPLHLFVKYTDSQSGTTYNLEATSGANPARDIWLRQQNPMTDEAIANGIYMQKLTRRETVAVMADDLAQFFSQKQEYEKVIAISDVLLTYYPKDVASMLWKGSTYARLIKKDFVSKYPTPNQIPPDERNHLQYLEEQNRYWFAKAEKLGWREPDRAQESRYMQNVDRAKSAR
jgi:regulator of sirC expression with transglutaminase-like and TPR domain